MNQHARTPVLEMLHRIYDHHNECGNGWSWERLNAALGATLQALIRVGATFDVADFAQIAADRRLRFGYWAGTDSETMSGERFYGTAVEARNLSACLAFEDWKQRPPFIWPTGRLYVGARCSWAGEEVRCTSFAEDGGSVVLCSYKPRTWTSCLTCGNGYGSDDRKIHSRFRVTIADIRAAKKAQRAAQKGAVV